MYASIDQQLLRHHREEIQQEVAANCLAGVAHRGHEPRPYVVRDLSWELARYAGLLGKRLAPMGLG